MSFLDLYQGDQAAAMKPQPGEANDLPATFGETFEKAWNYGRLFGQSVSGENARGDALQDYIDDVHTKTGENIASKIDWSGMAMGGALPASMLLDQANDAVKQINAKNPNAQIEPIDQDELERRAVAKSRQAGVDLADVSGRETTFGGKLGLLAGGLGSAATDPVNLLALPIAPETEGVSLLAAGLRWGAVAAGSQAVIEAAGAPYREEVQPGYATSGAPFANVAEAFVGGMGLGAGTRALGNLWTRMKTGTWPTSIRDAGNVVESEANVANTNPFPGAAGEVAHREAMTKTIDDVLAERPANVDNIITPDVTATIDERVAPLIAEREKAASALRDASAEPTEELPFEQTAASARAQDHLDVMTDQISRLSRAVGYSMPHEEAARIADRLARGSDEDMQETLNQIIQQPNTAAEPLKASGQIPEPERTPPPNPEATRAILESPDHETALRADIDRERMAIATGKRGFDAFHGSPNDFEKFDISRAEGRFNAYGKGVYLAKREEVARGYRPAGGIFRKGGTLYRVRVNRPLEEFYQVGKPLEEQSEFVRSKLGGLSPDEQHNTAVMRKNGIAGTEFEMGGSDRGYSVFDPNDLTITHKNGKAVEQSLADLGQIPVDVDKDGNVIYRSLDDITDEIDAYHKAADQIAACAAPVAEEAT